MADDTHRTLPGSGAGGGYWNPALGILADDTAYLQATDLETWL